MSRSWLSRRDFGALAAASALLPGVVSGTDSNRGTDPADGDPVRDPAGTPRPSKSIAIYVGSDLTDDGSTMLGGFGHEQSSHWIDVVPRQEFPADATTTVGVTEEARIPGRLTEIPQAEETNKYISSFYSQWAGFPAPLTNGGLNEHGLAARDVWSPSRPELVELAEEAAPLTGPQYSDLAKAAMERASTAREAVEVVGGLMDEYGYSTYGGNSHLFADEEEGWVFVNFAHPDGDLWAAERLGSDEVRVSYPGYILDFPVDHEDHPDYVGSDRLVSFAEERGWWDGSGDTLNLLDVYGAGDFPAQTPVDDYSYPDFFQRARNPLKREAEIEELAPVRLEDMLALVRDPRWSTDFAGYGQVAHLRPDAHEQLQTLWTAVTSAITTPFVPIPIGAREVPPEFRQHRYMTANAASNFLDRGWQLQEATRYATRTFKRLLYFTCDRSETFHADVTGAIEGFEQELLAERDTTEQAALELLQSGQEEAAADLLTDTVEGQLLDSLQLGVDLVEGVEAEYRARFGFDEPEGRDPQGETTPPSSQAMAAADWGSMIHCYHEGLDLPREHGAYTDGSADHHVQSLHSGAVDESGSGRAGRVGSGRVPSRSVTAPRRDAE
jgi:dipeptidase